MTPQQREQFIDACIDNEGSRNTPQLRRQIALDLDSFSEVYGVSISLDSVRDHTECEVCRGAGILGAGWFLNGVELMEPAPCPGGSPVVWSAD